MRKSSIQLETTEYAATGAEIAAVELREPCITIRFRRFDDALEDLLIDAGRIVIGLDEKGLE